MRVGDPLARVRESYDRVRCGESIQGEPIWSDEPSTCSWCMTRVGDIGLHFGGDPIQSITVGRAGLVKSR